MQSQYFVIGFIAGIFGTVVMDLSNLLLSMTGVIGKVSHRGIGRVAAGWVRGQFVHESLEVVPPVEYERLYGAGTHYGIGGVFGGGFMLFAPTLLGGIDVFVPAVLFGAFTTVAAWFVFFPSIGWGMLARKGPPGGRWALTSFVNHLNYGIGLAIGIKLVGLVLGSVLGFP